MKPLKEKISITLDSEIIKKTRQLAEEDDRSLSQYINLILRKHIVKLETLDEDKKQSRRSSTALSKYCRVSFLFLKNIIAQSDYNFYTFLNHLIKINFGTYLFERNGERLTARQIAYVLEKYAERQGVATKSTHKMRKTYASRLNASGVPLDAIREQLGHADLTTTLSYIYNPLTDKETYDLISNAL